MTDQNLNERVRAYLCQIAGQGVPITYQALASALGLVPPQTICQLTDVLEVLMAEDVAAEAGVDVAEEAMATDAAAAEAIATAALRR